MVIDISQSRRAEGVLFPLRESKPATLKVFVQCRDDRSDPSSSRCSPPMQTYSRDGISSIWNLDVCRRNLCCLLSRVLANLLRFSPNLLKNFRGDVDSHLPAPAMEIIVGRTLPELPQDILMDIFSTLEIPDLVRAGSVCSSWHSAYTTLCELGKYNRSQTPCLLYTSEAAGENVACLYSLAEKRTYNLTLPEPAIRSRFLIGCSYGWLVTVDERSEMHLVNPMTGEQVALPSVITMEHVKPIVNKSGAIKEYEYSYHTATRARYTPSIFALTELREHLHYKAFVFPDTSKGSYIVVLIHDPLHQLSFSRVGDDNWTWLPPHTDYEDCNYKDGLLYALSKMGEIHTFDISGPVVTMKMVIKIELDYDFENMYIVQAPWGDLLTVWRDGLCQENDDPATHELNTEEIKIFKVDTMARKLVKIKCLDEHVLFLGHNQTLCLNAEEYPPLKANHAYFTDNDELWIMGNKNCRRDIGVFNVGNNSRRELVSPQLWSNWPNPLWITPSLAKMNLALDEEH